MAEAKLEFPGFVITGDPSLLEVTPKKMENRREFAKCATMLELQHMLSRRSDLAGAVMVQKLIEGHEENVLKAMSGVQEDLKDEISEVRKVVDDLPLLTEIENIVGEKLRHLKEEGIIDLELLAEEIRKELNDAYGLNDLCDTLRRAYSGDGQVTMAIQNIRKLLDDVGEIRNIIKAMPTGKEIAEAVASREKEKFDQIKEHLNKLEDALSKIRSERIRKMEKIKAVIEAGEQEFEKMAGEFLHEEFNPRYKIVDVRDKVGALGRKTGDHILERNGTHNYKVVIDWKKTNPEESRIVSMEEAQQIAENSGRNRKADASIICTQLAEQLPPETNGIYFFSYRTILTHFRFLRLAVELVEIFIELDKQKMQNNNIDIQRVEEVINRLREGNSTLERTIRSLKQAKGSLTNSISRLINYQHQVAENAIQELKIMIK